MLICHPRWSDWAPMVLDRPPAALLQGSEPLLGTGCLPTAHDHVVAAALSAYCSHQPLLQLLRPLSAGPWLSEPWGCVLALTP